MAFRSTEVSRGSCTNRRIPIDSVKLWITKAKWPPTGLVTSTALSDSPESDRALLVTNPVGGHLALVIQSFTESTGMRRFVHEPLESSVLRKAVSEVFGQESIPDFDIDNSDYLLSFGADFLSTWISPTRYSRGYGEFRQGHERQRGRLVHVDSRFSVTAAMLTNGSE